MFTDIIKNWEDGLLSTGEALSKILSHPTASRGYMLDAVAGLALQLLKQESDARKTEYFDEFNKFIKGLE